MPHSCPFDFCGMLCFLQHARRHQFTCQFLHTQLFPLAHVSGFTPAFILLVVRLLVNTYIARVLDGTPGRDDLQLIAAELASSYTDYKCYRSELWDAIQHLARALCQFFPICAKLGLGKTDMDELICKIHAHSFIVESYNAKHETTSLLTIAPVLSKLTHSCIPNLYASYQPDIDDETRDDFSETYGASRETHGWPIQAKVADNVVDKFLEMLSSAWKGGEVHWNSGKQLTAGGGNRSLVLRSIAFIDQGDPVAFSYVPDLYKPTNLRKALFQPLKVLQCCCVRCRDPSESLRFVNGIRCPQCLFGYACPRRLARVDVCIKRFRETSTSREGLHGATSDLREARDEDVVWKGGTGATQKWECSRCGLLKTSVSEVECDQLISSWQDRLIDVKGHSVVGMRGELMSLYEEMLIRAHSANWLVFETLVQLVGLYKANPGRDLAKALGLQYHAMLIAQNVLPTADLHHTSLGLSLIELLPVDQLAPTLLHRAYWSAYCCLGPRHGLTLYVLSSASAIAAVSRLPFVKVPGVMGAAGPLDELRQMHLVVGRDSIGELGGGECALGRGGPVDRCD
ncbi:hypothetical protein GNI_166320 [Gregarina niphandrodes]|uniref:SET domain-containing protein n=1 Tax=Gregarina niphandrodes TaxID=110365 RepID=A0A023AY37_GRENI|nr:hypothetical protein GNI_166320 [Gregarina niphandrodes]EZG43567.1 hypothetical protein GNI_166320 [Gregarina niphandrodes]|eukprot:XP_011133202.1 hypothetical protein GNI_166320 [Gregarina niphandrodes]